MLAELKIGYCQNTKSKMHLQTKGSYVYSALATEVRSYGYGALKAGSVCGISTELHSFSAIPLKSKLEK